MFHPGGAQRVSDDIHRRTPHRLEFELACAAPEARQITVVGRFPRETVQSRRDSEQFHRLF
jgi:hypothetical protein